MKKYTYPPFLTMIVTALATFVHKLTGYHVDVELATAAFAVIGNYLVVQFAADIQKIRRGEFPDGWGKFNSLKFITVILICILLGISNYLQLDYSTEQIVMLVGMAMTVITGKGLGDIFGKTGGMKKDDSQPNYSDHGPSV